MCLDAVKESYDEPSTLIVDGWKEFRGSDSKPTLQFKVNGKYDIPLDKWIPATQENAKEILAGDRKKYVPGFHAYSDEREVKGSSLRRVFLRRISCMGTQSGKKTLIAQEMYVPADKNGWPPKGA